MSRICGCSSHEGTYLPERDSSRDPQHSPDSEAAQTLLLERQLLARNAHLARANRVWLAHRRVTMINLIGAPGAGKTTLLEATIACSREQLSIAVLEGDQDTTLDAERIERAGARALQINTGARCHLDAAMIGRALERLDPDPHSLVLVENVGNLLCPALFDLGERARVVVMSVTEGEDKPLKYPHVFRASDLFVLNKLDLQRHAPFDLALCVQHARRVRPGLPAIGLSARTGEGLPAWLDWLVQMPQPLADAACWTGYELSGAKR